MTSYPPTKAIITVLYVDSIGRLGYVPQDHFYPCDTGRRNGKCPSGKCFILSVAIDSRVDDGAMAVGSAIATANRKAVGTAERRYCGERYSASTRPSLTEYQPPLSCERRRSHSPVEKEEPSEFCKLARIVQTSGQHLRKRVPRRSPNESRPFSRLFQSREGRTTVKIDLHGFSKSVSSATLKCVVHVQVSRLASPGIFGLCLALSLQVTGGFHHGRHEVSRGPLRSLHLITRIGRLLLRNSDPELQFSSA